MLGCSKWALSSDHFMTLVPICPWGITKIRLIYFSVFCFTMCQVIDSEVEKRPWWAGHWVWGYKLTDTKKVRERWARNGEEWACRDAGWWPQLRRVWEVKEDCWKEQGYEGWERLKGDKNIKDGEVWSCWRKMVKAQPQPSSTECCLQARHCGKDFI